jgi:hypothetical protein
MNLPALKKEESFEFGMWNAECGIEKNSECGMRNAELKRIGKSECGIEKNLECGMWNAELKRRFHLVLIFGLFDYEKRSQDY